MLQHFTKINVLYLLRMLGQDQEGDRSDSSIMVQLHSFHSRHYSTQPFNYKLRAIISMYQISGSREGSLSGHLLAFS